MQNDEIISQLYAQYQVSHSVTTDTRNITPGAIFFAFKGASFDGNAFAAQALEDGAAVCVISDEKYRVDDRCIVVPDVLDVLQQLALCHRRHISFPVIGITGTNGKTTTKELVREVLAKRYKVHATTGNHNNHLGVPLTLLSMPADTEIAIVEMGANHPGEIEALCSIAMPDFGLITNVGKAHLEGFGSFEGVIRTKTELYRHLAVMHGTIFVNADNEILMSEAEKVCTLPSVPSAVPGYIPDYPAVDFDAADSSVNLLTYGRSETADVKGALMESNPYMRFYIECDDVVYTIQSHLLGGYNFDNAMAAAAVGLHFGVEPFDIKEAIEAYWPTNNRSQYKQTERNVLFLDCYNANPSSMHVSVENFANVQAPHKMVILGSMRELGSASHDEHRALMEQLLAARFDSILLVGEEFGCVADLINASNVCHYFTDTEAVMQHLKEHPVSGATILIKGSNSNRLWQLEQLL
ncbi:MAG: UDP-N-acetylmuramoyl-tripeptide--D-alanyl-D-alanine ligase [Bacteroidales bacterium]|nr:UDP-N-acetylmuramoyl-tripeptide--D-alanyl-D-alanine ligase [Bacteroidales bacterium]